MRSAILKTTLACAIAILGPVTTPVAAKLAPAAQVQFDVAIGDAKSTMQIDPDAAIRKATIAANLAERIGPGKQRRIAIATAQWLMGEAYLRLDQTKHAAPLIASALASVARFDRGSSLHANILLSSGGVHGSLGQVGAALSDYQAAHDIFRSESDTRNRAKALMLIGALYSDGNDATTALRYLGQALEIYSGDPGLLIAIYANRGSYFQDLGRYAESEGQYREALKLAEQMKSPLLRSRILGNMARTLLKAGKISPATAAITEAMRLTGHGEAALWRVQLMPIAAELALRRGDRDRALALITQRFDGVDPLTTTLSFRESHQVAYDVYKAIGDPALALVHLAALKRLDDQATKLATNTSTALMAARFDFANQELRISKLRADELQRSVAYEQSRARTQRYLFLGATAAVAAIIGMLAIGLLTIRRSRDEVRAANDDLAVTNSALAKALAAKTEFLATTSHEIRTPLNGILGMTQVMLADTTLKPQLRDRLGLVLGAGQTMRALVDDILDVAKMETGNLTIESAPFDLCATVTDATRMWEEQAAMKGLAFEVDTRACPAIIMGDAARVRQIVFNLLSNALKFTRAGTIRVVVRSEGDRLRLDVSDSGIGIPAAKMDEIFESFRQADAGTTRQFGGTGLGLSICRNLAQAMGGQVTVTSVEGRGATFTLDLPLVHAEAVAQTADTDVAIDGTADTEANVITLIVDRNPITRSMFKTLLAPHSDGVLTTGSIDDAIAMLAVDEVAHVVVDDATVRAAGNPHDTLSAIADAVAGRAAITVLWPVDGMPDEELMATGITRVIRKPVSGADLVGGIFGRKVAKNNLIADLVSEAA